MYIMTLYGKAAYYETISRAVIFRKLLGVGGGGGDCHA